VLHQNKKGTSTINPSYKNKQEAIPSGHVAVGGARLWRCHVLDNLL